MKTAWITALVFVIGMSQQAWGFWSLVSVGTHTLYDDHADITNQAIGPTATFNYGTDTAPYKFSPQAVRAITKANEDLDSDRHNAYSAADHFDNSLFGIGVGQIITRRSDLKALLSQPITSSSQQQAWMLLGKMLHSVQDFYAHSTWVEEYKYTSIVDFGKITKTPPPDLTKLQPGSGTVCGPKGYPLIGTASQLITGYYDHSKTVADPAPPGLCQHGTLSQAIGTCQALNATVAGISKDSPCASYPESPPGAHDKALKAALSETTAFVQSIISDFSSNPTAFCALLGLTNAPICFVGTLSGTIPLQSQGVIIPTNNVSFGVTIDVNGAVTTAIVPIYSYGTTVDNWFVTDCPPSEHGSATSNVCAPFGQSYDWPLDPTSLCVGDGTNGCGPKGSALLKLVYREPIGIDDIDHCDITINLTTVAGLVQAAAAKGSVCKYLEAGFNTILPADKNLCFNAPTGQVCP